MKLSGDLHCLGKRESASHPSALNWTGQWYKLISDSIKAFVCSHLSSIWQQKNWFQTEKLSQKSEKHDIFEDRLLWNWNKIRLNGHPGAQGGSGAWVPMGGPGAPQVQQPRGAACPEVVKNVEFLYIPVQKYEITVCFWRFDRQLPHSGVPVKKKVKTSRTKSPSISRCQIWRVALAADVWKHGVFWRYSSIISILLGA